MAQEKSTEALQEGNAILDQLFGGSDEREADDHIPFSAEITGEHWRFDPENHENIYIVGDVHGCYEELTELWSRLEPSGTDLVVFVGDLIRKGPASRDVVEFIAEQPHAVSVLGNNEEKVLRGTVETEPYEPIVQTIERFPLVVSWNDTMVVHGGIHPNREMPAQDRDTLLEMRSVPPGNGYEGPFWFERHDSGPRVCFGHTVLESPLITDHAVGLDTGCVYGGELTAYDWRRDDVISVPAHDSYESRPDDKILLLEP